MSVQQIQLTNIHPMPQPRQYICNSCILPEGNRNYCLVDKNEVDYFVSQKEKSLPYLADILQHSQNEAQVTETLLILDRMSNVSVT